MGFSVDNQILLYIIIALFVVQFLVMRYYVQTTVEDDLSKNNKKLVKKLSKQINSTFDQYMGNGMSVHAGSAGATGAVGAAGAAGAASPYGQPDPREMSAMQKHTYREEMMRHQQEHPDRGSRRHMEREVPEDIDSVNDPAEDEEDDE